VRVLIASSVSPFSARQEMYWAHAIEDKLRQQGTQVDMLMLPIIMDPLLLADQMLAYRLLEIENSCDLLITIGYPAFVLKHSRKRVCLFSLASHLHEWYNTEYGILSTPQYERIRHAVINAEKRCLEEAERILCASRTLTSRLQSVHKLKSTPMLMDHGLRFGENGGLVQYEGFWLVCESTLEPFERIDLLLSALVASQKPWRLHLFIPSASDVYYRALEQRIVRLDLRERIVITGELLSESSLAAASACIALPFAASRIPDAIVRAIKYHVPLISTSDSGALLEVVQDKKNGLVVEPSAFGVAQAVDRLVHNSKLREQLSHANRRFVEKLSDVDTVVKGLIT
jgi:glycosyltransferase involved in cell wall biosynthesis